MLFPNLAGPVIMAAGLIFMFLVTPYERIKELFWFGLVGGLILALVLIHLMQNVFGFWQFQRTDLLVVQGVPVLLAAAWTPVVIAYGHLLAQYRSVALAAAAVLVFPAVATLIHAVLLLNNMLFYAGWSLPMTFAFSLAIHLALLGWLYLTGRLENLKGLLRP